MDAKTDSIDYLRKQLAQHPAIDRAEFVARVRRWNSSNKAPASPM